MRCSRPARSGRFPDRRAELFLRRSLQMKTAETVFVIPTYRLRDIAETIETYDEHFWSNGHSVKMMV